MAMASGRLASASADVATLIDVMSRVAVRLRIDVGRIVRRLLPEVAMIGTIRVIVAASNEGERCSRSE
jgi:hypothetical protein